MTGVYLGLAMTLGGIQAILNMKHSTGTVLGGSEVGAHFIGGEAEVHQMKGDTLEMAVEVRNKGFILETVRGPGFAGTEQAGALRGRGDLTVVMRFLWRAEN
jgi:hypothetical protein